MTKRLIQCLYIVLLGIAALPAIGQAQVEALDAPPAITGQIQGRPVTEAAVTRLMVSGRPYVIAPDVRIAWQNGRPADFSALTPGTRVQLGLRGPPALGVVDRITLLPE
jgi:hypothetical protein